MCVLAYLEEEDGSWRAGNNKTVLFLVPVREIGLRLSFWPLSTAQDPRLSLPVLCPSKDTAWICSFHLLEFSGKVSGCQRLNSCELLSNFLFTICSHCVVDNTEDSL